jgi:hypothetical protein
MSEVKVNKISPRTACGTVTLGDSGDTFTIPSGATITNSGTATGFGATGETSWDTTVKTTGTFTATAGVGYFLNTTGGIITVNLPAGAAGSSVALADYAGTWQTNNVTVSPNGSEKIGGINVDVTLSTEGQSVTFVYIDSTQGWVNVLDSTSNVRGNAYMTATVSGACNTLATAPDCANAKIATFLGPGTFCVSAAAVCAANNLVSYMVVAGGGGGSAGCSGGGGGAGGFREYESPVTPYTSSPLDGNPGGTAITVSATPYPIVVGAGGAGGPGTTKGINGSVSTFSTICSAGGGAGGVGNNAPPVRDGADGGSGGGGGHTAAPGGTGNTPPVSPAQGKNGADSVPGGGGAPGDAGGGGGGATVAGTCGSTNQTGGAGATTSISATPTAYAGGGGGSSLSGGSAPQVAGGAGGGGNGSLSGAPGTEGTTNTGGGGGAASNSTTGGAGGSGIVIIRYKFQ